MSDQTLPPAQKPGYASGGSGRIARQRLRIVAALILREMATRYGRTPGGYAWALLEPLGIIVMLSIGFALLLRSPPLGNSFILFYATGYLPLSLFLRSSRAVMQALTFSRPLLKYPVVSWLDTIVARSVLNILTDLLVAYVLLTAIILGTGATVIIDFPPILLSFVLAALLAVGVGLINCVVIGFYPIWGTIWSIITRPLFLASGVIWLYRDLPTGAQDVLWWNPLLHIISIARTGYFPTYEPQFVSVVFALVPSLVLIALGLMLMRRFHLRLLNIL